MKQVTRFFFMVFFGALLFGLPLQPTSASTTVDIIKNIDSSADKTYNINKAGEGPLQDVVTRGLTYFISALGIAAVALIIYAGILWMTAGGNEEQIGQAKTIMKQVVIGMVVVWLAYSLVWFVLNVILKKAAGT